MRKLGKKNKLGTRDLDTEIWQQRKLGKKKPGNLVGDPVFLLVPRVSSGFYGFLLRRYGFYRVVTGFLLGCT